MCGKTGTQNLEDTIHQLQASGVLFCFQYVGSVVVEKSINSLSAEKQAEVARACMCSVVATAMPSMKLSIQEDNKISKTYVHGPVQSHQKDVEMNISSTQIVIIDGNPMRPLHRFKIQDVSLLSPGFDELASFFCFFAKVQVPEPNQWLRKCFVFNARTEMEDVRDVICFAFRLNEHNNILRRDSETKEGSGIVFSSTEEMTTETSSSTQQSSNNSTQTIPKIRIAARKEDQAPEVPPRPRRYTSGNVRGMERMKKGEQMNSATNASNNNNSLLPGLRQGRSGTMTSTTTTSIGGHHPQQQQETRSNSISPRAMDISVQITPERYKELTRDLSAQNWYHGILPRLKADALIRMNGQFLVRQSPNIPDQFVLVGMFDDNVRHVCLVSKDGKIQTSIGEFKSIVGLINYFHQSRSPLLLRGEQLQLHCPVNREHPLS